MRHGPRPRIRTIVRSAIASCGLALATLGASATAQPVAPATSPATNRTERLVPLDGRGTLLRIDVDLARRLGLFVAEHPGFEAAQVWQQSDSSYVLEITTHRGDEWQRERSPLVPAAVDSLRAAVVRVGRDRDSNSGRTLFITGMAVVGLGYYSWGVPVGLDLHDKAAVATGLLTATAVGFFLPYAASAAGGVDYGMANLSLYGASRGVLHGMLVAEAFKQSGADIEDYQLLGAGVIGSVVEAAGGFLWARAADFTAGDARSIGVGGDTGMIWGGGLAEVFDGRSEDFLDFGVKRALPIAALGGSAAGIFAGQQAARRWNPTWGDGEVTRMASLVGAVWGVASANLDDDDTVLGMGILGNAAGLAASSRLLRGRDFTPGQAALIDVGTVAGAGLGIGVAYLFSGSSVDTRGVLIGAAAGASSGFALTYWTSPRLTPGPNEHGALHVDFDPFALLGSVTRQAPAAATTRSIATPPPIVTARWRF